MKKYVLLTFFIFNFTFYISKAQPGTLDSDFDADGKLTTDFDQQIDEAQSVIAQSDGKILVGGSALIQGDFDFAIARYNTDGTLDNTFGNSGKNTTSVSVNDDVSYAMLLQPDGKIVLAGYTDAGSVAEFALVRYNANGMLDNTFGSGGIVTTQFGNAGGEINALLLLNDGKILAGGNSYNTNNDAEFAIACYNTDGTLDQTFGTNGKISLGFNLSENGAIINDLALQPDGKILAAGFVDYSTGTRSYGIMRLNSNGSLDNTFSIDGRVTTQFEIDTQANCSSVELQPDGKILASGYAAISGSVHTSVARYNTDGTLDLTFSSDGKASTASLAFGSLASAAVLQPDGKIITAGVSYEQGTDCGLVRFNTDGSLDNSFGTTGFVTSIFSPFTNVFTALTLTPDLKIIAVGYLYNGNDRDFLVVRYLSGLNLGIIDFMNEALPLIYPNPVNETTVVSFELANNEILTIGIYEALGKQVKSICENKPFQTGKHELVIDAANLTVGQYTLVIENTKAKTTVRFQK